MLALLLAACAPDLTPAWAYDPIWLEPSPSPGPTEPSAEPSASGGAHGFQTWQLYGPDWEKKHDDRHYVCAVVVELAGAPIPCDAEPGCEHAWSVVPTVLESDCADASLAEDPLFTSLTRLAIGGPASGEVPWPGATSVAYADYGRDAWEVHGDAYPEALDHGGAGSAWDGVEPFQLVPNAAFPYLP